jgi:hypothetical protein
MPIRLYLAIIAGLCLSCQYPWSPGERSCADHANLDMPIDLGVFAAKGTIRPYGVHGGFNPEGHPGMDFILSNSDVSGDLEVKASFTAEIVSITPETDYPGSSCIVMDSACIEVNLCHLRLDPSLKAGNKVKRGQSLGTVGLLAKEGQYNLHFGTYSGREAELTCPTEFLNPDTLRCTLGLVSGEAPPVDCGLAQNGSTPLGRSVYPEALARSLAIKCLNGTSQSFDLPAETGFCAPRLSSADRSRMNTCLGSACAGIW